MSDPPPPRRSGRARRPSAAAREAAKSAELQGQRPAAKPQARPKRPRRAAKEEEQQEEEEEEEPPAKRRRPPVKAEAPAAPTAAAPKKKAAAKRGRPANEAKTETGAGRPAKRGPAAPVPRGPPPPLLEIDPDAWRVVLSFLPAAEFLGTVPLVSHAARERLLHDETYWKRRCVSEFGVTARARLDGGGWYGRFCKEMPSRCVFCLRKSKRNEVKLAEFLPLAPMRACERCARQQQPRVRRWVSRTLEKHYRRVGGESEHMELIQGDVKRMLGTHAAEGVKHYVTSTRSYMGTRYTYWYAFDAVLRNSFYRHGSKRAPPVLTDAETRLLQMLDAGHVHPYAAEQSAGAERLIYLGHDEFTSCEWRKAETPEEEAESATSAAMMREHGKARPETDEGDDEVAACVPLVVAGDLSPAEAAARVVEADAVGVALFMRRERWARMCKDRAPRNASPAFAVLLDADNHPLPCAAAEFERDAPLREVRAALEDYWAFEAAFAEAVRAEAERVLSGKDGPKLGHPPHVIVAVRTVARGHVQEAVGDDKAPLEPSVAAKAAAEAADVVAAKAVTQWWASLKEVRLAQWGKWLGDNNKPRIAFPACSHRWQCHCHLNVPQVKHLLSREEEPGDAEFAAAYAPFGALIDAVEADGAAARAKAAAALGCDAAVFEPLWRDVYQKDALDVGEWSAALVKAGGTELPPRPGSYSTLVASLPCRWVSGKLFDGVQDRAKALLQQHGNLGRRFSGALAWISAASQLDENCNDLAAAAAAATAKIDERLDFVRRVLAAATAEVGGEKTTRSMAGRHCFDWPARDADLADEAELRRVVDGIKTSSDSVRVHVQGSTSPDDCVCGKAAAKACQSEPRACKTCCDGPCARHNK